MQYIGFQSTFVSRLSASSGISTVIPSTAKSTYYRSQIMAGDREISELKVV